MSSPRTRSKGKKSSLQMDKRLSQRLMELVQEVAQEGDSVDLRTTIDNKEINISAKKKGKKFHLSFEVPDDGEDAEEGSTSDPKLEETEKEESTNDSSTEDEDVEQVKDQSKTVGEEGENSPRWGASLRSRREGKRVSWKNVGGTLEKVVIKEEKQDDVDEDSIASSKVKKGGRGKEVGFKAKGKGKKRGAVKQEDDKQEKKSKRKKPEKEVSDRETEKIYEEEEDVERNEDGGTESSIGGIDVSVLVQSNTAVENEDVQGKGQEEEDYDDEDQHMLLEVPVEVYCPQVPIKMETDDNEDMEPEADSEEDASKSTEDPAGDMSPLEPEVSAVPRRKVGRPKKNPDMIETAEALASISNDTLSKKGKKRAPRPREECNMCQRKFVCENLERHKRYQCRMNPDRIQLYRCDHCLYTSEKLEEVEDHKNIHPVGFKAKNGKKCVCEVCGIELDSMKAKLHHEWKVHNYFGMRVSYNCEHCGKCFPTKWQYDEHMGYHFDRKNFMCDSCGRKFRSKQEVKDHQKFSHIADLFKYQCQHCRVGIRTADELAVHECKMVAELIQNKGFRGVNQVVYVQEFDDDDDGENEGVGDSRQKDESVKVEDEAGNVIIVDKVKDGGKDGKEDGEDSDGSDLDDMDQSAIQNVTKAHEAKVEGDKDKDTAAQKEKKARPTPRIFFDLQSIAEFQTGPIKVSERYMCEYCGELFVTKVQKFVHRKTVHGYRKLPKELRKERLECEICGKKFVYKDSLKKHYVHTHSDERRYACDICGKQFKRPTDRDYHMNTIHNNQFKFYCEQCGHGVHRQNYLKNHQCSRVHRRSSKLRSRFTPRQVTKQAAMKCVEESKEYTLVLREPAVDGNPELNVKSTVVGGETMYVVQPDVATTVASAIPATAVVDDSSSMEVLDAASIVESGALADILPKSEGGVEQKWIIQQSTDGQQILVIQEGLASAVGGSEQQILVEASGDTGSQEVEQICKAAAILQQNLEAGAGDN